MSTDEMTLAENLPQADASLLVDREVLESQVKDLYRLVAREEEARLHFEVGRRLALRLGYPATCSTRSLRRPWPAARGSATTSTSPRWRPGTPCSISARVPGRTCSLERGDQPLTGQHRPLRLAA